MTSTDIRRFAIDLAQQAGELLAAYFERGQFDPTLKADHSVVTQADVAADTMIAAAIQENFPHDTLLSEELAPHYTPPAPQQGVWVVDPLDGTNNFAVGLPIWGVLIARIVDGWPDTAALYFPLLKEMYSAQRAGGAFFNGRPLHTPAAEGSMPISFFSCCTRTHRAYRVNVPYKTRILGATGYNLCAVARGMACVGFEATPKIWDLAAGWLLLQEAGAAIEAYQPPEPFPLRGQVDYARQSFSIVTAATSQQIACTRQQILSKT